MTAKEYLQQIRKADIMINYKQQQLDELRSLATSITSAMNPDKVQSSCVSDKVGDAVAKIVDLQNEINRDIDKLVDLKKEVMKVIDKLDATSLELIYSRYFEFKTWEQIVCQMNYSCQWIWKLHGEALKKVSKLMKE